MLSKITKLFYVVFLPFHWAPSQHLHNLKIVIAKYRIRNDRSVARQPVRSKNRTFCRFSALFKLPKNLEAFSWTPALTFPKFHAMITLSQYLYRDFSGWNRTVFWWIARCFSPIPHFGIGPFFKKFVSLTDSLVKFDAIIGRKSDQYGHLNRSMRGFARFLQNQRLT